MNRYFTMAAALLVGLSSVSFTVLGDASAPPAAKDSVQTPGDPDEAARRYFTDLEVVDQHGNLLHFYSDVLKDRVVLINFIFTNCENACSLVTKKLLTVRQQLVSDISDKVWFISISIDPQRDTPAAMKAFAQDHKVDESRWVFLTGAKENVDYIVKKLGQYSEDVESHSMMMLAGNTKKRHWKKVPPMLTPDDIVKQLLTLTQDSAG